jgi:putative heme degradation protein
MKVYIVSEIEKYWSEGKSVFVIYGASQAGIQEEPALRSKMEDDLLNIVVT